MTDGAQRTGNRGQGTEPDSCLLSPVSWWFVLPLSLLQIIVDALRLAHQKRNVLLVRFDKPTHGFYVLLKLFHELLVLLIAPGGTKVDHLPLERSEIRDQLAVELFELLGKTPQFRGIDNRLRHIALGR